MQKNHNTASTDQRVAAVVIGNGPSRSRFTGFKFTPLIGCNHAYRDFKVTHCVVWDRSQIKNHRPETMKKEHQGVKFFTPGPSVPDWHSLHNHWGDSGTAAVALALELFEGPILCWGFDGCLGGSTSTAYDYDNRPRLLPENKQQLQKQRLYQVCKDRPVYFAWYQSHSEFRTVKYDLAIQMVAHQNKRLFRLPK